jgi:hypothetical protein
VRAMALTIRPTARVRNFMDLSESLSGNG